MPGCVAALILLGCAGARDAEESDLLGWKVEENLRIGSALEDAPDAFGHVWALEVDSEGRIYVADGRPPSVKVFGPDGAYRRTLGREGEGPGEFRWPVGLKLDPLERLWVIDYRNARYSVFNPNGELVRTANRSLPGWHVPWPGEFSGPELLEVGAVSVEGDPAFLVAVDTARLAPGDTISFPEFQLNPVPFAPELIWTLGRNGELWFARTDEYRVYRRSPTGDTQRILARPLEPEQLSEREKIEALEAMRARMGRMGGAGGVPDLSDLPDRKPILEQLWLDSGGSLWVMRTGREKYRYSSADVFAPSGDYLGQVELPFTIRTPPRPVFRDGQIYAVTEDELGVQRIIRARVER